MDFKTKYNLGDEFWIIRKDKVEKNIVNQIVVSHNRESNGSGCYKDIMTIFYYGRNPEIYITENEFFPTKEALIKSL